MNLGALIRRHRKHQKLTLKAVSHKAGISEGFLSQVENSVHSPSVDTLVNICKALGINAGDLLNQVENHEKISVIRKDQWDEMDLPHTGFVTRRFFAPENRTVIDCAILLLEPDKNIPVRKDVRNGQEVLCILKGALELEQGAQKVDLYEGDAVQFWSDNVNQRIVNTSGAVAVALWVGTL
jgi:transcriptional regulator with XRE-family HTH domain